MDDFCAVAASDINYALNAYYRQQGFYLMNADVCSHSHERDFLCRINTVLLDKEEVSSKSEVMQNVFGLACVSSCKRDHILEYVMKIFPDGELSMQYSDLLLCCASLLIDFHEKHECSEYMTSALRLHLAAYEHIGYNLYETPENIIDTMVEFLRYISIYKCRQALFIECLNMFLHLYDFMDYLSDGVLLHEALPDIFAAAHVLRFCFFTNCGENFVLEEVRYRERAILDNLERFFTLARYGYEDTKYEEATADYMQTICKTDKSNLFGFRNAADEVRGLSNDSFRQVQVLFLYVGAHYDNIMYGKQEYYDRVLHILWQTIPDPFLTQKQFMSSFKQSSHVWKFLEVWKWYSNIVLNNKEHEYSPRSLKHLARCAIRRVLAESAQLPFGIPSLDIPEMLKGYLFL